MLLNNGFDVHLGFYLIGTRKESGGQSFRDGLELLNRCDFSFLSLVHQTSAGHCNDQSNRNIS